MANKDEVIQHFIELTGVDVQVATFYLDSSNWDIETALSSYYANDGEEEEHEALPENVRPRNNETHMVDEVVNNYNMASETSKPKKNYERSNIATLSSLKKTDSDSDDEDKHGQAFYVGGSEHGGGQQVLGPPKHGKKSRQQDLESLFKSAQRHGAEVVGHESDEEVDLRKPFSGSGYKLGESTTDQAVLATSSDVNMVAQSSKPTKVSVKIWSNGFTVDDGPLRLLTDPSSADFMRSLSLGQIPTELQQEHRYSKIDLKMEIHSGEEYKEPPRPRLVPFQGSGNMLGSPTPAFATSNCAPLATLPVAAVVVNESEPITQVQIRLVDNSRMVVRLNHGHTVGDVRASIVSQYPQYRAVGFTLMTTFPNKVLTDDAMTLRDGNLLNSVLIQRLC